MKKHLLRGLQGPSLSMEHREMGKAAQPAGKICKGVRSGETCTDKEPEPVKLRFASPQWYASADNAVKGQKGSCDLPVQLWNGQRRHSPDRGPGLC